MTQVVCDGARITGLPQTPEAQCASPFGARGFSGDRLQAFRANLVRLVGYALVPRVPSPPTAFALPSQLHLRALHGFRRPFLSATLLCCVSPPTAMSNANAATSCLVYSAFSMTMVLANKVVVTSYGFKLAFSLLFFQSLVAVAMALGGRALKLFTFEDLRLTNMKRWIPINIMFCIMLFTGFKRYAQCIVVRRATCRRSAREASFSPLVRALWPPAACSTSPYHWSLSSKT